MEKKYELTENTKEVNGHTLYCIRALRDIPMYNIKKGDLGGWIESEANLSQEGNCWISKNGIVCENAQIFDHVQVSDNAIVCGYALVYGNSKVCDNALVYENGKVCENVRVSGNAKIFGNALVYGNVRVSGNAQIYNSATVSDHVYITDDAVIKSNDDYITIGRIGSRLDTTMAFRTEENIIKITCGCFHGTIEEFKDAVMETHKDNDKYRNEYLTVINLINIHFNLD